MTGAHQNKCKNTIYIAFALKFRMSQNIIFNCLGIVQDERVPHARTKNIYKLQSCNSRKKCEITNSLCNFSNHANSANNIKNCYFITMLIVPNKHTTWIFPPSEPREWTFNWNWIEFQLKKINLDKSQNHPPHTYEAHQICRLNDYRIPLKPNLI